MAKHSRDVAYLAGLVYFTQGAYGIVAVTLPLYLRQLQWSVSEITIATSVVTFPWVLKILYGILSDCLPLFSYRRKSYLIVFALAASLGWLCLAVLPPAKGFILGSLILSNIGFAAIDVITDGFVVEHSRGQNSHIYQSISWGMRSLGAILSGFTGGWLAAHWPPRDVFILTICLPLFVIFWALRMKEVQVGRSPFRNAWEPVQRCFRLFSNTNLKWFILILILSQVSAMFSIPFFFHMKETLEFKETFLGGLMSLAWTGAVIASLLYVRWLRKVDAKTVLSWAMIFNTINILSTVFIYNERSALVLVFLGGILGCLTMLPIMSVSAILTHNSGVEGTSFAVLMSIHNLGQIVFGFLGGHLYPYSGLYPLIFSAAVLSLVCLGVVQRLKMDPADSLTLEEQAGEVSKSKS